MMTVKHESSGWTGITKEMKMTNWRERTTQVGSEKVHIYIKGKIKRETWI